MLLPALVVVAIGAFAGPAGATAVDCAKPSGHEQQRACVAAANGVHELRRFIQRTRGVYILYIQDFESRFTSVAAVPEASDALQLARR
jgi:hypothetical protein